MQKVINKIGELGFMGICVNSDYGGSGMDTLRYHFTQIYLINSYLYIWHLKHNLSLICVSYAIAMEEISRGCASGGVMMHAQSLYAYMPNPSVSIYC